LTNIPLPQKDGTMLYQTQFSPRSSFLMAGDSVQVRLYPRGKAGKESLLFSILGQTGVNKELKVEVLPAEAYRVNLRDTNNVVDAQGSDSSSPSKALMEINESKELRLQVTDVWGNRVDRSVALQVGSFGPVSIMGDDTAYISSEKEKDSFINVDSAEHGGRAYVYTRLNDISLDQQEAGFFEIIVQESFLPMKNLNVMYLNLW